MKNLTFLTAILIASLSFAQVPSYVPTTGLIGWWPFNGNANDASGNGNNGTVNGATLTADRNSVANKAYNFNGTSNFISINPSSQAFPNGISISIWAKISGLNSNTNCNLGCAQFLVSRSNDFSNGHFKIGYSQNTVAAGGQKFGGSINSASGAGNVNGTTAYTYPQTTWKHLVITYNNSQVKLYINGLLNATTNYTTPITNINSLIYFGRHVDATYSYFVNGQLDDIGIWNRALTTCEVTNLYSTPVVSAGPDLSVCQGLPVTLTASGATSYSWNNSVINGQAFTPTTTQNYVVAGTINGCTLTDTVKVTVNPTPIIPNETITICSGETFIFTPVNNPPSTIVPTGTSFSWPTPIVTGGMTGSTSATNQVSISHLLTNITNSTQTAIYTVTPMTNTNGNCVGNPFTITVSVNPIPFLNSTPNQVVCCQSTTSQINFTGNSPTYNWTASNNPNITGYSLNGINSILPLQLTNLSSVPQTLTYFVSTQPSSCNVAVDTFSITVLPCPDSIQPNYIINQLICNGTANPSIQITGNATNYSWVNTNATIGLNSVSGSNVIPSFIGINSTISPITSSVVILPVYTYNSLSCNGTTQTFTITVNPTPLIFAGNNQSICSGDLVTLSALGGTSYTWDNNVINSQPFAPSASQTYIVIGTDSFGCIGSDTVTVSVSEPSSSSQTQTALDTYTWPVNNQTYTQSGTYSDTLINAAGCDSIVTLNLTLSYTGINELNASQLVVSPNPTKDNFSITGLELLGTITSLEIKDAAGKVVKVLDPTATNFSCVGLKAGVYFLAITSNKTERVVKIIKE
jgi:hypothetical protein